MSSNNYIGIEGEAGLAKDPVSNSIVNTDRESFEIAKQLKQTKKEQLTRQQQLETRVSSVELKLDKILSVLEGLQHG